MDVILKVLEGAKVGAKVAIRKDEFLIGRSPKCHLCAGSSTISRRHCKFTRKENSITVEDLGSRNGTLVNGRRIEAPTELNSGDEIAVGSLKFLITISTGLSNEKRPQVKSVAEAVERAAAASHPSVDDDDISKWLLEGGTGSRAEHETETIQLDDTNAAQFKAVVERLKEQETADLEAAPEEPAEKEKDSKKKSKPGKLPPVPTKPASKDSREAAMEALRNFSRRR